MANVTQRRHRQKGPTPTQIQQSIRPPSQNIITTPQPQSIIVTMSSRSSSDEDDAPSIPAPLPAVQAVDLAASNEASATASPTVDVPRDLMADVFGSGSELTESEADDEEAPIRECKLSL